MKRFLGYLALVVSACAAIDERAAAQPVGDTAGPRPGSLYELEVAWTDSLVQYLDERGYNIDDVVPGEFVVVHATEAERAALIADGLTVTEREPAPVLKSTPKGLGTYSTYASLTADLQSYAAAHTDIARLSSLGQSVQGRELWALFISDNPDDEEAEPEFKYVSTIHGDEPVGTEMCLYLIDRLLNDYGVDSRITTLVDETAIWIVPLMNPDGHNVPQRNNVNGFDLNRSFPIYPGQFQGTIYDGEPLVLTGRQAEVRHVMTWTAENSFVLSANLHTGALVVNYPYDHEVGTPSGVDAPAPDKLLFEDISLRYSMSNPPMFASFTFPDGITNGSDWFSITGGMQDWNYRYAACNEVTIELSNVKTPAQATLPTLWANNEESMLAYMESVHIGVRGIVTKQHNGLPLYARITVQGNSQPVFTDPDVGDYYRMLLPGTYTITVDSPGYYSETATLNVGAGPATVQDFQLEAIELGARAQAWPALLAIGIAAAALMRLRRATK